MVLKIIMDFKGQLTVARPILSAGDRTPHIHGLLACGSSHSKLGNRWDSMEVSLELRLYLLWGKVSGSNSSVVVMGLGTLGHEFWLDSYPISGSLPELILGSEPRLASLAIAVSQ